MHGHHPHAAGWQGRIEARVGVSLPGQPHRPQEPGGTRGRVTQLKLPRHPHQRVQGGKPALGVGAEQHLDVHSGDADDAREQVRYRLTGVPGEPLQLAVQQGEPAARGIRVGPLTRVTEGIRQARQFHRVGAGGGGGQLLSEVRCRLGPPGRTCQVPGPSPQQGQVAHADRPPRAGQQPHQVRVRARVHDNREDRQHVLDFRQVEQACLVRRRDRDPGGSQRPGRCRDTAVAAGEHDDVVRRAAGGELGLDLGHEEGLFVGGGTEGVHLDGVVDVGAGCPQAIAGGHRPGRPSGGRGSVGNRHDARPGTEVTGEREDLRRSAVGGREMLGERLHAGRRRAAKAVDRLLRVPHGQQSVAATEQPLQQQPLHHRGVLVFVE